MIPTFSGECCFSQYAKGFPRLPWQTTEGFARELGKGLIEAYSAGLLHAGVHPRAIAVMEEAGIDISKQQSKEIDEDLLRKMDVVITLCTNAEAAFPWAPPGVRRIHWPLKDPVGAVGTEENIMKEFHRARDEIRDKVLEFIEGVKHG